MFKPDQPIKSYKDDILDRHSFAQSLGDAILSYKGEESITIGLFGAWGSGKTSIINMSLERIELVSKSRADDEKPIIIRFNPWNYSDQNQLITQFFRQLSVALRRPDYASDVKKAGELLETYAKFFKPFTLVPTIGSIPPILYEVFKHVGDAIKSWGDLKSNDLDGIKSQLNEILKKQAHKIIVVIDDIDRLNDIEIRQIFQLVKSLGDFPNTIYLLAFDKEIVIKALEKVQEGSGAKYLEKLIQIPFEIPLISREGVEDLLFNQLNDLIKDIPENKWDPVYWGNIYHSGFKYLFRNIRDVIRYINSLRFSFEIVKDEVNIIDFLAITAIQVFIPEIYCGIRDNKDIFCGMFNSIYRKKEVIEQAQKRCDEIIGRVSEPPQEVLKDFLKRLFPMLRVIYDNTDYGYDSLSNWRKNCRICSPDIFDIYFKLAVPRGGISQREIETILSLTNNPDSLAEALLKLNEDGRIIRFLDRLVDYTQNDIPKEDIESVITVLMDIGDLFTEKDPEYWWEDTHVRLHYLFVQLSHRFDNQEMRFNILKCAMEKAIKSLYTIVYEVSAQDRQHGKYASNVNPEPEDKRTVNSEQLQILEKIACKKIENWANDSRLKRHRHLPSILFQWEKWGEHIKVNDFVNDMVRSDEGLIDFITVFLSKVISHSVSDHVGRINWRISLKNIEEFVALKEIEPRIREIFSSSKFNKLDEQRKLAIKTFLDTIDGKIEDPS